MNSKSQRGSLTMEYIILTLFGAISAIASVSYLSKTVQKQLDKMEVHIENSMESSESILP